MRKSSICVHLLEKPLEAKSGQTKDLHNGRLWSRDAYTLLILITLSAFNFQIEKSTESIAK